MRYQVNEKFFYKWNSRTAYLLGFIYADGTIYPSARGKYFAVTNTDKILILITKRLLQSTHPITHRLGIANRKDRFILRIGNKNLYDSLVARGLYPSKSLTIRMPSIPQRVLGHFVRGYFDGDGCVSLYRTKGARGKLIVRKLSVIFTSGSKAFLEDLLRTLQQELPLRQTRVYNGHRSFQLRFATHDSIALYWFLYHDAKCLALPRKKKIFEHYRTLRKEKVGRMFESLSFLKHGEH